MNAESRKQFEEMALPLLDNLYCMALRLTRNSAEAEDLVQDAMVRAYRFWSGFKPGTSIKAWLFTILRNTFINRYRQDNRVRNFASDLENQIEALGNAQALGSLARAPISPELAVSTKNRRERIQQAFDQLPEDYRMAVALADIEGLSYKEIAEAMDCPIGTVMSRVYRGRRQLHQLLYSDAVDTGIIAPKEANTISLDAYRQRETA